MGDKFDDRLRHKIIGLEFSSNYDCKRFHSLSPTQLMMLMEMGFCKPGDRQNDAPSALEFLLFSERCEVKDPDSEVTFTGYIIEPGRDDCRVSIEGCAVGITPSLLDCGIVQDFISMFRHADDFEVDGNACSCWFD